MTNDNLVAYQPARPRFEDTDRKLVAYHNRIKLILKSLFNNDRELLTALSPMTVTRLSLFYSAVDEVVAELSLSVRAFLTISEIHYAEFFAHEVRIIYPTQAYLRRKYLIECLNLIYENEKCAFVSECAFDLVGYFKFLESDGKPADINAVASLVAEKLNKVNLTIGELNGN